MMMVRVVIVMTIMIVHVPKRDDGKGGYDVGWTNKYLVFFSARALMQLPSASRDRLIAAPSFRRSPVFCS